MYNTIASALGLLCRNLGCIAVIIKVYVKREGHLALNRSPEFCLKLTYRYLLKAGHVPVDTWVGANFGPRG